MDISNWRWLWLIVARFEDTQLGDALVVFQSPITVSSNVAVLNMPGLNGDVHWEHDLEMDINGFFLMFFLLIFQLKPQLKKPEGSKSFYRTDIPQSNVG